MTFGILGPLAAWCDGEPLELRGRCQRVLLASLLIHANDVVPSSRLMQYVWGEDEPATAANALQVHISHLRRALGEGGIVSTQGGGYTVVLDPSDLDATRFERAVAAGRVAMERGSYVSAAQTLRDALAVWRGDVLSDFAEEPFAQAEIARLDAMRLGALEDRFEAELAAGVGAPIEELRALVAKYPAHEGFQAQLMIALYRAGRQEDALAAFHDARRYLIENFGIEPGGKLQRVQRAVLNQDASLDRLVAQPTALLRAAPSSLIGRDRERAAVIELISRDDVRLVSLTGPPGIGKTRLAEQVGVDLEAAYPNSVVIVQLAPLRDPKLVPGAIAEALGMKETSNGPTAAAVESSLASHRRLLVLDNFEHLLSASSFVARLLETGGTKVLITSRSNLRLSLEHDFPVPPLLTEDAVQLFVKRASLRDPTFRLTDANADAVIACVEKLEGLPLAIELAAARSKLLSPKQMVARLEHRLEVLADGPPDLPSRQRTLRAAIDWSHDLLTPDERESFHRLSVFSGGWTLEAAEAICGLDVESQASLVNHSLVRRTGERFSMLEALREYAHEQLEARAEGAALRRRHAEYFLEFAETARQHLLGEEQPSWLSRLEVDHDNLRSALKHFFECEERQSALRLVRALVRFWFVRGHWTEGRMWSMRALAERSGMSDELVGAVLAAAGVFADRQGDLLESRRLVEESLAISRRQGDRRSIARCLSHLGSTALGEGRLDDARDLFEEALGIYGELRETVGSAVALNNLGELALIEGDVAEAERSFERALALHRARGNMHGVAISLQNLAMAELRAGRSMSAVSNLQESLSLWEQFGEQHEIAYCLRVFAAAASPRDAAGAARLIGAAEVLRESIGASLEPYERRLSEETLATLHRTVGADGIARARVEAKGMTPTEAISLARETAIY